MGVTKIKFGQEPYEKLKFYQNICEIRKITFLTTEKFNYKHHRLTSQMRDAARSAKQNIREGYKKDSALSFGNYIKISIGSLDELLGDYQDCLEDRLIDQKMYNEIAGLIKKTIYMMSRYLDSLYQLHSTGKWKLRWSNNHN